MAVIWKTDHAAPSYVHVGHPLCPCDWFEMHLKCKLTLEQEITPSKVSSPTRGLVVLTTELYKRLFHQEIYLMCSVQLIWDIDFDLYVMQTR